MYQLFKTPLNTHYVTEEFSERKAGIVSNPTLRLMTADPKPRLVVHISRKQAFGSMELAWECMRSIKDRFVDGSITTALQAKAFKAAKLEQVGIGDDV